MAAHRIDLTGERFGRLVAVKPVELVGNVWHWEFMCSCGTAVVRSGAVVRRASKRGLDQSCGCACHLITHNLSSHKKLYAVWKSMRQRCSNPNNKDFHNYGGRGISVCEEWSDFKPFFDWASNSGYREGVTIERVDVNGGYAPHNCTWVVNELQALNTRKIRTFTYLGKSMTIRELSELAGVNIHTMKNRLTTYGWSVEEAVAGVRA